MEQLRIATDAVRALTLSVAHDAARIHTNSGLQFHHVHGISLLQGDTDELPQSAPPDSLFVAENEPDNDVPATGDDAEWTDTYASDIEDSFVSDEDLITWVNNLARPILELHGPLEVNFPAPCPGLLKEPKDHQYRALGLIERARDSKTRTLLIGDPPGLGKTFPAMMAVVKAKALAHRFSIVVAPASCLDQWAHEFATFFKPGTIQVLVLRDPTITPTTLLQYDVVICSYHFVMSRYQKKARYLQHIAQYQEHKSGIVPCRPNLSIFSEIFEFNNNVLSPILILDEANAVKNHRSKTFLATLALRQTVHTCVMLTGSPIDNQWPDIYALLQFVQGHDLRSRGALMNLVATPNENHPGRYRHPTGLKFGMLVQILIHFTIRRPESTVDLPPLTKSFVKFELSGDEGDLSNQCFEKYQKAISIASSDPSSRRDGTAFKSLTHALQHACHPKLVELMQFIRLEEQKDRSDEEEDVLHNAAAITHWTHWRENLKTDKAWRSSRINAIIDAFNKQRDLDPDCSLIIFDESVYFLDIVQIAFEAMYDPVECIRYDGRQAPEKRGALLQDFKESRGSKVLLMSRAAGGVGLNIPCANAVIQCSPWWKTEWEEQAYKRVWRPGQTREVTYIMLQAINCRAETYKAKARNKKHKFNTSVVNAITRDDGDKPYVFSNFR